MTTQRMYRCNLCTDFIQPTDSAVKEAYGVAWGKDKNTTLTFIDVRESEKHICHQCAVGVHAELRNIMPHKYGDVVALLNGEE